MLVASRSSRFSYDPGRNRRTRRERWVPLDGGWGDLRPRWQGPNSSPAHDPVTPIELPERASEPVRAAAQE